MEEGPVVVGMRVYRDLYAYHSGIYRPSMSIMNQLVGGHAVTGMGFGPGYMLCVNSWGPRWGQHGAFKVVPEAIDFGYFLPGHVVFNEREGFPLPLPLQL